MIKKTRTATLFSSTGEMVVVEANLSRGMPFFNIVGLTDKVIKESSERIRAAITNAGFNFPLCRITVNLSPAYRKKMGSHFDLPIAVAILLATGDIKEFRDSEYIFFGELTLEGKVTGVSAIFPLILCGEEANINKAILPNENKVEASIVKSINIIPVKTLNEVVEYLNNTKKIEPFKGNYKRVKDESKVGDFSQVYGQESVKRAMVIAATGGHNIMMMGSPGIGKTMMAKRFIDILPPMDYSEMVEVTKIYSISGMLNEKVHMINKRPFRQPYSTITQRALIGGGHTPKPGEISLAHKGVLFLDEFSNFDIKCIETLRKPLEDKEVYVSRMEETAKFPADFILIGATNPCKCGFFGDDIHMCTCSPKQISSFMRRISGPILDRIDIHVRMASIDYKRAIGANKGLDTKTMKEMVIRGRKYQKDRYKFEKINLNNQLEEIEIEKYCKLDEAGDKLLSAAYNKFGMSVRAYNKMLKISRTIADLQESEFIKEYHLAEALQYREFTEMYRI